VVDAEQEKPSMKPTPMAPPEFSPDNGDALALTFAMPVEIRDHNADLSHKPHYQYDYDPDAEMWKGSRSTGSGNPEDPYAHLRYRDRSQRFEQDWEPEWIRDRKR